MGPSCEQRNVLCADQYNILPIRSYDHLTLLVEGEECHVAGGVDARECACQAFFGGGLDLEHGDISGLGDSEQIFVSPGADFEGGVVDGDAG